MMNEKPATKEDVEELKRLIRDLRNERRGPASNFTLEMILMQIAFIILVVAAVKSH